MLPALLVVADCLSGLQGLKEIELNILHRTPLIQPDAAMAFERLRSAMPPLVFVFLILSFF